MAEPRLPTPHHTLTEADLSATVPVRRGLCHALRVLHLSDSHVSCGEGWMAERQAFGLPAPDPIHTAYTDGEDETAPSTQATMRQFREQVAAGVSAGAELIVHTGDLLNIPSEDSVAFVHSVLTEAGLPFVFISGNHDWCYEGLGIFTTSPEVSLESTNRNVEFPPRLPRLLRTKSWDIW